MPLNMIAASGVLEHQVASHCRRLMLLFLARSIVSCGGAGDRTYTTVRPQWVVAVSTFICIEGLPGVALVCLRGASELATEASSTCVPLPPPRGGAPQPAVQKLVRAPQPVLAMEAALVHSYIALGSLTKSSAQNSRLLGASVLPKGNRVLVQGQERWQACGK